MTIRKSKRIRRANNAVRRAARQHGCDSIGDFHSRVRRSADRKANRKAFAAFLAEFNF